MDNGMRRNSLGRTAAANTAKPAERNKMLGASNTDRLLPAAPFGAFKKPSPALPVGAIPQRRRPFRNTEGACPLLRHRATGIRGRSPPLT
ncbi:hypothetical protein GCM10010052_33730 [Paenarthrobacter histidinolovorans]|nr:hypothetical protein GCM10010052_33730 [Paenarthrobacter histidinolovorans]